MQELTNPPETVAPIVRLAAAALLLAAVSGLSFVLQGDADEVFSDVRDRVERPRVQFSIADDEITFNASANIRAGNQSRRVEASFRVL